VTYDFFVFPADRAADLEDAQRLYTASPERGPLTPGGPVDRFLADLARQDLTTSAHGHDGGAVVATSWDDPRRHLAVVAGAARPHGLTVLDVQLTALYDPRGALEVRLETEAGPCLPFLTRPVLRTVLSHLVERRYTWVRLSTHGGDGGGGEASVRADGAALELGFDGGPTTQQVDPDRVELLLWEWAEAAEPAGKG
jgi:hypothetical protein